MDNILSGLGNLLSAGWNGLVGVLDGFMNVGLFLVAFVIGIISTTLFAKMSNVIGKLIFAFLIGASIFAMLLSINMIANWRYGFAASAVVGMIAVLVRLGDAGKRAGWPGKILVGIIAFGLIFALFSTVGGIWSFPVGSQLSAFATKTSQFINQIGTAAERGARSVR